MKEYDVIAIGSGSSMNIISWMMAKDDNIKVAVIDKDEPGGICLTRGCIPSKLMLYPAELVRTIEKAGELGVNVTLKNADFTKVMQRMRHSIDKDIDNIRKGLSGNPGIDYYTDVAEFVAPYVLKVGNETITSKLIFLCLGSEVLIPPIEGIEKVRYITSDTILHLKKMPESVVIVGGGYIAAEYGHFLSAMGSKVTIVGRNQQFLKNEEPEISSLARREMSKHMTILTNHEVLKAEKSLTGKKALIAKNRATGKNVKVSADEILIASGRVPNTDILHPERGGIETDERGWIKVNGYLETSQSGVWAFGDAIGRHLFKHAANYESIVVLKNAILGHREPVDYHAVPHAVFSYPEVAGVGMSEIEAIQKHGKDSVSIGVCKYEDTAKGQAMGVKEFFAKVIVENKTKKILGAHIIGPQASVLIQEIINLMYTDDRSYISITRGMHIHPALSEIVERAFGQLMPVDRYHHTLSPDHGHGH